MVSSVASKLLGYGINCNYRKYVSNNALVYVSLLILTHIAYYRFVLYDYYSCSVQNVPFIMLSPN